MANYRPESLRAIIPVGGKAKRLLPLTAEVSKACVRLINRPLIEISLLTLARQGVRNFIFGVKGYTNYKSLHDYFKSGVGFSARYQIKPRVHIKYQPNEEDYGSADSTRINIEYYDVQDPVFAVQGDNIFDINLENMLELHRSNGASMTIGLRPVKDVSGYGIADIDKDKRILRFVEKPHPKAAPSNLANTGLYLVSPKIKEIFKEREVRKMIKKKSLDFGFDLIPYMVATGRPVYGYILNGAWYDVGTPLRYLKAMQGILHGQLKILQDFGGRISGSTTWVQGESIESIKRREEIIGKVKEGRIELVGSVLIGRHCKISDGVRIVDSSIDNYTQIGKNVIIEESAIMDRVIIGDNAEIRGSIIGRHSTISSSPTNKTEILETSVIADDATIDEGCRLIATKVYPHKHLHKQDLFKKTIN